MIPKIIHYCWFGGNPLPELAKKCIASWKKYCPDYEIIEWNESNYDISSAPLYVRQAYEAKKWAFATDYIRYDVLYKMGGVYFDVDVELIKPIDNLLIKGAFMGCENDGDEIAINPGIGLAFEKENPLVKEIIDFYHTIKFIKDDGTQNLETVVIYTTKILLSKGLKRENTIQNVMGISIYPTEYFCPKDFETGELNLTDNTYSIHHFDASWFTEEQKYIQLLRYKFAKKLPHKIAHWLSLMAGFTKYRGFFKMPKAMIEFKIENMKRKKEQNV